jgi:hypothetical protein
MAFLFDTPEYTCSFFVTDMHDRALFFTHARVNCFRRLPHSYCEIETQREIEISNYGDYSDPQQELHPSCAQTMHDSDIVDRLKQ